MKLSTAEKYGKFLYSDAKLSTPRESVRKEFEGILSKTEMQMMRLCQKEEDRNHITLERIAQCVRTTCFNSFPWLQCESVEFCRQQRPEELVRIFIKDDNGHLPRLETAQAIEESIHKASISPWQIYVERQ